MICSFCRQSVSGGLPGYVRHMDTCIEVRKVRMLVSGGWPRVCCSNDRHAEDILYDECRADEHAARFHQ